MTFKNGILLLLTSYFFLTCDNKNNLDSESNETSKIFDTIYSNVPYFSVIIDTFQNNKFLYTHKNEIALQGNWSGKNILIPRLDSLSLKFEYQFNYDTVEVFFKNKLVLKDFLKTNNTSKKLAKILKLKKGIIKKDEVIIIIINSRKIIIPALNYDFLRVIKANDEYIIIYSNKLRN